MIGKKYVKYHSQLIHTDVRWMVQPFPASTVYGWAFFCLNLSSSAACREW